MDEFFEELLNNHILWTAIISWFVASFFKVAINFSKQRTLNLNLLMSSGGMPSSHTAFVMAMTTMVGIKDGFDSSFFAISTILSFIVMYDATGVRQAAGKQAAVLNKLLEHINNPNISLDKKLEELLGHTPIQVTAGAIVGITVGIIAANVKGYV